ncbi:thermonuclease family protein [Piscinibacter gummiphilus]|uniref:Thermonuclease family protein n=1 Tax=Piscinibacter gummiphilus TaxID=946333 RepID=A0ABZ0D1Y9_9BURK|nr:thermonuclease family protein [Piscinibacter gummiphilus]WOB11192.1 thermonuclease family protein [Piscinibacter gummiphilus]
MMVVVQPSAWAFPAEVVGITDGDTLTVLSQQRKQTRCRLAGIDAPEKRQAFGSVSKQSLSDLAFRKVVEVNVIDRDRYGRSVCLIKREGVDLNLEQVRRGMAWVYLRYNRDRLYRLAEEEARKERRGLWSEPVPVPPWEFRKRVSQTQLDAAMN